MPQIPTFDNTALAPIAPGPPRADPALGQAPGIAQATAGQEPGLALAQVGQNITTQAQDWSNRYAEARRQSDAAALTSQGTKALGDAAFKWSKVPDHLAAAEGFNNDAKNIQAGLLSQSADPLVQGYVGDALGRTSVMFGLETQRQSFGLESNAQVAAGQARRLQWSQQAALAPTPELRANFTDMANADIAGQVAAGWLLPEQGEAAKVAFGSDVAKVGAKQMILANPEQAAQILADPAKSQAAFPGLLPVESENLARQAENRAARMEARAQAAQAHADMMAQRRLVIDQGTNAATLIAQALKNPDQPMDVGQLATMVGTHQLSESGFQAIISAQGAGGQDKPAVVIDLHRQLNDGNLTPDDITNAFNQHTIKQGTAVTLLGALNAQDKQGNNQQRSDGFRAVDDALGGGAVDKGLVDLNNVAGQALVAKRAAAVMEYSQRVDVNNEDPLTVAQDIIKRYSTPPSTPKAWPAPRMGAISSAEDVQAVASATVDALKSGAINQQQYDAERLLIGQYQNYYANQPPASAAGAGAAKSTRKGAAAPPAGLTPAGTE